MTVKADSKGRLTGAQPGRAYIRKEQPDGTVQYVPEVPNKFVDIREVTREEFEGFFGVSPSEVPVEQAFKTQALYEEGYLPFGLVVEKYVINGHGQRVYSGTEALREQVLIKIKKDPT